MTEAYPLQWPDGWQRKEAHLREDGRSRFKRGDWSRGYKVPTLSKTAQELRNELERLGATDIVISSNLALKANGLPYAKQKAMTEDPGIAVYFRRDGDQLVMARDAFSQAWANMRSLTLAVEALRKLERHGGDAMTSRAFAGFSQLPPPPDVDAKRNWRSVLNVSPEATLAEAQKSYRRLAGAAHPDNGGDSDQMAAINIAWEQAQKELQQ